MPLDRSVVIVTGATSGIGAAIAETLCRKDHAVVLVGRNRQAGTALQDRLTKNGASALFLAEDLYDDAGFITGALIPVDGGTSAQ